MDNPAFNSPSYTSAAPHSLQKNLLSVGQGKGKPPLLQLAELGLDGGKTPARHKPVTGDTSAGILLTGFFHPSRCVTKPRPPEQLAGGGMPAVPQHLKEQKRGRPVAAGRNRRFYTLPRAPSEGDSELFGTAETFLACLALSPCHRNTSPRTCSRVEAGWK